MFSALSRPARHSAMLIAGLAAVSVAAQFLYLNAERAEPALATAWEMARYFTILTNIAVAVTLAMIARPVRGRVPAAWLAALTLAFGEVVYLLGINDLLHGILAFAPGGQPEMVMLAILTGADITYVIFHHVLRLLIVMSLTPVLSRWLT